MGCTSILTEVKKEIGGINEEYTVFDPTVILAINAAFATLCQLGVGPSDGFRITGYGETWDDYISEANGDDALKDLIKEYVCIKTKIIFDPPQQSYVLDCYKSIASELEWRLNVYYDRYTKGDESSNARQY